MKISNLVSMGWLLLAGMSIAEPAWSQATTLQMQSQPGDYIGGGLNYSFNSDSVPFTVSAAASSINVTVNGIGGWTITLLPPSGGRLDDGVYEGAQRAAFHAPGVAGMEIDGPGRGCNTITGRFELFDVKVDSLGTIFSFILQFEQHCEGATPALFGQMAYNADPTAAARTRVSAASGTVLKGNAGTSDGLVTVSLSRPTASAVSVNYATADGTAHAGVDYVATKGELKFSSANTAKTIAIPIIGNRNVTSGRKFSVMLTFSAGAEIGIDRATAAIVDANGPLTVLAMNSQTGDFIGGGVPWLELSSYTTFAGTLSGNVAIVNLGEPEFWSLDFAAPSKQMLVPKTYKNAQRYPFEPPSVPGLTCPVMGWGAIRFQEAS